MFISLEILEQKPIEFREDFAPGTIDLGPDFRQSAALHSEGRATLIEERHGHRENIEDIRLVGDLATMVEAACARCLDPVAQEISRSFDLLYRPQGADAGREELSVTQAEAEIGYYTGDGLLLEDVLREQILLAAPFKMVCREDCKGLCPHCGQNLNAGACGCEVKVADPRWNALSGLKDKLKD
jgi:uncharacterized protein